MPPRYVFNPPLKYRGPWVNPLPNQADHVQVVLLPHHLVKVSCPLPCPLVLLPGVENGRQVPELDRDPLPRVSPGVPDLEAPWRPWLGEPRPQPRYQLVPCPYDHPLRQRRLGFLKLCLCLLQTSTPDKDTGEGEQSPPLLPLSARRSGPRAAGSRSII